MPAIIVDEHVSFRLRPFLIKEGYWVGSAIGDITPWDLTEKVNQFGLIIPPIKRYNKFLWFKTRNRGQFIGVIWLSNLMRDASLTKQWVIEVYGRKYLPQLTELANKIREEFDVPQIVVRLIDENPREEYLFGDGSFM